MDSVDLLADDNLDGQELPSGASSTEDFWMFFSFSMILLVFVLMNYVNYLNSLVVKAPEQESAKPETQDVQPATPTAAEDVEVHLLVDVVPGTDQAVYRFADDDQKQEYSREQLQDAITERLPTVASQRPMKVFVHAPGTVLYQAVFDASFAVWQVAEAHPDVPVDVHLVYEERQQ